MLFHLFFVDLRDEPTPGFLPLIRDIQGHQSVLGRLGWGCSPSVMDAMHLIGSSWYRSLESESQHVLSLYVQFFFGFSRPFGLINLKTSLIVPRFNETVGNCSVLRDVLKIWVLLVSQEFHVSYFRKKWSRVCLIFFLLSSWIKRRSCKPIAPGSGWRRSRRPSVSSSSVSTA